MAYNHITAKYGTVLPSLFLQSVCWRKWKKGRKKEVQLQHFFLAFWGKKLSAINKLIRYQRVVQNCISMQNLQQNQPKYISDVIERVLEVINKLMKFFSRSYLQGWNRHGASPKFEMRQLMQSENFKLKFEYDVNSNIKEDKAWKYHYKLFVSNISLSSWPSTCKWRHSNSWYPFWKREIPHMKIKNFIHPLKKINLVLYIYDKTNLLLGLSLFQDWGK